MKLLKTEGGKKRRKYKPHSLEARKRNSERKKEYYKNHEVWNKGKKMSVESRRKLSESSKRRKLSDETKQKISAKIKGTKLGKDNPMWKGDQVGFHALHDWIRRHKPKPKFCEKCHKKPPYDLANVSGEYIRDVNDFEWLCRKCHMQSDNRLINFMGYAYDHAKRYPA